ncbi:UDP-glycosyltransferase 83a1 [Phtheirospermum japonicum]|uniref:UDP-glycosyltransferase 83a1 n=1 Tax=Phtheirospermum japonicum TaxID=374723 RepID=A0A830D4K2_9LAMI|nr:UDP-glycosyltransferase 83a1 [Phtheirospermum japonicum]
MGRPERPREEHSSVVPGPTRGAGVSYSENDRKRRRKNYVCDRGCADGVGPRGSGEAWDQKGGLLDAPAAVLALSFNIPNLISDGIVDSNGKNLKNETIRLSPTMPRMNSDDFIWACIGDEPTQKIFFHSLIRNNVQLQSADWLICNSCYHLEPGAFSLIPNSLPVGPLLASNRLGKTAGYFWPEHSTCLALLDRQPTNSVIYVAYGTSSQLDRTQFEELALGLELTNRPFL